MSNSTRKQVAVGLAMLVVLVGNAASQNCPATYDFTPDNVDYYDPDPKQQQRIGGIEHNHMNEDVRNLRRPKGALRHGQTTYNPSGDLRFVIGIVPNHREALTLLMRLAFRDRTDRPPETEPYTVECWLHRATVFSPSDGSSFILYGIYLARKGKAKEAIATLERADELKPGDANVAYNLGLMHFELRDYARSLDYAKRAYAAGFPLPGLRDKLKQAGQWSD